MKEIEVSVVIPCLNESETIGFCVEEAIGCFLKNNILGEVVVVDNSSKDNSAEIALNAGARVVLEKDPGYGRTLQKGFREARGRYVFMADADMSYDFNDVFVFLKKIKDENADMIIGCRFERGGGKIENGAMPFLHRHVGNPFLSFLARIVSHSSIVDFHCGQRMFRRDVLDKLCFTTSGMEFATEMIMEAIRKKIKILQLPIVYRKSMRKNSTSHLLPVRDGLRHLFTIIK